MKFRFVSTIVCLLCTMHMSSQEQKYSEGYVVLYPNDTLYGQLRNSNEEESCSRVKFISASGEKQKLKTKEIKAYQRGDEYFVNIAEIWPERKNNFFVKLINDGTISLFRLNYTVPIVAGSFVTAVNSSAYYLKNKDDVIHLKKKGFSETMSAICSENTNLVTKIRDKELKYRDIETIVALYNTDN